MNENQHLEEKKHSVSGRSKDFPCSKRLSRKIFKTNFLN